ncbi:hypothetical protein BSQ44_13740 [Aquibium oceanicum]|uniref:Transglycosylase SLT domain-containing protein n=1 Tax=Aquibium oceanicum TaxID=1670800 RepID=A0A1L3SYV1_9HYPH|nr:hypothetical protein BSQ44_13740 [Aquibium oceanicum]
MFGALCLPLLASAGCSTSGVDAATVLSVAPMADPVLPAEGPILSLAEEEAVLHPTPEIKAAYAGPTPSSISAAAVAFAPAVASPDERAKVDRLITHYAAEYEVPEDLVRRVVKRESNFRPAAYNRGHWGLMQIKHATARGMGYDGPAEGLLDAETNLRYAVRYLRGAYMVAGGNHDRAVQFYARGYYYDAKRAGLLDETGLGRDRTRKRKAG